MYNDEHTTPDGKHYTWNYRVIEFDNGVDGKPWREIREVHYVNGTPNAYSSGPIVLAYYLEDDDSWENPRELLDRCFTAIHKPVLRPSDFKSGGKV